MSSYSSSGRRGYRKSHRGGGYYKRESLLTKILKLIFGGMNKSYKDHGNSNYNDHNYNENYNYKRHSYSHSYSHSHSNSHRYKYKKRYSSS